MSQPVFVLTHIKASQYEADKLWRESIAGANMACLLEHVQRLKLKRDGKQEMALITEEKLHHLMR